MILNGMGGIHYTEQHAYNSAQLMNAAQPNYLSTLVLSFPQGMERFNAGWQGDFEMPDQQQLFEEMQRFISALELDHTVFRSDHASNYLALKGVLGRDKETMLDILQQAIDNPTGMPLREEWQRGL